MLKNGSSQQKTQQKVVFYKLGGTWDMIKKNGSLIGSGNLDDENLFKLEESLGYFKSGEKDLTSLELKLAKEIDKNILENSKQNYSLGKHLSWVPGIDNIVTGKFISLYSGDSSHLRPALIAPLVSYLLKQANANPDTQILGAQGTDTADIALLPLLDAYTFDTSLLPMLFTGSNRSQKEWNSDAPKNFSDLIKLAGVNLPSGAYWIFAGHLYRASDFIKIDPLESRRIENYSTFFSPRLTARYTKKIISENHIFHSTSGTAANKTHVSQTVTTESLFKAMASVHSLDIGDQNTIDHDTSEILNKDYKAIILSSHSLGNASNPIRHACIEAALSGKLVVVVSRSLIGEVNERYAASLVSTNGKELTGTNKHLISGHKMNKSVAKSILTRALQEKLNQKEAQILVNNYCNSRGLLVKSQDNY